MGFLDKVKNLFVEEVEDEQPVTKEVRQVEIPKPTQPKPEAQTRTGQPVQPKPTATKQIEKPVQPRPLPVEKLETPVEPVKKEEKFVFPVYFDDKDFEEITKPKPVQPKPAPQARTQSTNQTSIKKEIYNGKQVEKIEKKVFKPTPIISPVYGILDKNYNKEDITLKKKSAPVEYRETRVSAIDSVRKKAFGTLEDDLENSMFGKNSILVNDAENLEQDFNLFKDLEEDPVVDVLVQEEQPVKKRTRYKEIEDEKVLEEELSRDYKKDTDEKLNDSDLFNLIDSMYEKKDDE